MTYTPNLTTYIAQVYGSGAYDTSTYDGGSSAASTSSNGLLTNTGFDILLIATIAVTLIFIALIIRFWKRPSTKVSKENL